MNRFYLIMFAFLMAMVMAIPAFAGQVPYVAVVDNDPSIDSFYISPELYQFASPETGYTAETFRSKFYATQREICDPLGNPHNLNSRIGKGNTGWYEWDIVLPHKPEGNLNIVIECGILKPNTATLGDNAINLCAAETGEVIGTGFCTRAADSNVRNSALPMITATAYPGCQGDYFTPFSLTAYKNPSNYALTKDGAGNLKNSAALQVLDGTSGTRVALKACMDKSIFVKMPKDGEINALGQAETALVAGDIIKVRMVVPAANTVDIYCHEHSVKIMGMGEIGTFIPDGLCSTWAP